MHKYANYESPLDSNLTIGQYMDNIIKLMVILP